MLAHNKIQTLAWDLLSVAVQVIVGFPRRDHMNYQQVACTYCILSQQVAYIWLFLSPTESSTGMTTTNQSNTKPVVIFNIVRNSNDSISAVTNQSSSPKVSSKTSKFVNKPNLLSRKIERPPPNFTTPDPGVWECPNITQSKSLECGCDLPHTLRCSGDIHGMELLSRGLRDSKYAVSLLDCTLKNVSILSEAKIFENISLHGLVISSGEIKRLHRLVFDGMKSPLYELGLPNNALTAVPSNSLQPLNQLDRLDLSNNKIKMLSSTDFTVRRFFFRFNTGQELINKRYFRL